ncbi:hypothetical protein K0U27_10930 [archaeon]|nr:hypothetical protein [archaeon]
MICKIITFAIILETPVTDKNQVKKILLDNPSLHFSQTKFKDRTQPIQNPVWFPFEVITLMG